LGLGGCGPDAIYEATAPEPAVRLPQDEGPHCAGGEWWYYTGRLATDAGRAFGIEAVIFHAPRVPLTFNLVEGWFAHYAVLDEAGGEFIYDQTRSLEPSFIPDPPVDGFELYTSLVQMIGAGGEDHLHAAMSDGTYELSLDLTDERGVVLHGDDGYVAYGRDGQSFYYSRPAMWAAGTLNVDGEPEGVTGHLWFDRQWGRDLTNPWLTWEWYSLRLDDGAAVMLFTFPEGDPPVSHGTYIPEMGEATPLNGADFEVTPTAWWTSPHTGITYPVTWEIHMPSEELSLSVSAVVDDQEFDARASTLNIYWEGLCNISGTQGGEPVGGIAYVELANFPP
jgi:predicted secreted hydrolase